MAVYGKAKLIRCKGNWRGRDDQNTESKVENKGKRSFKELMRIGKQKNGSPRGVGLQQKSKIYLC